MRRTLKTKKIKSRKLKPIIPSDYLSLYEATALCSYSQEYLSLLARRHLIKSKKFGRNWYITEKDLAEYCLNNSKDKKGNYRGEISRTVVEETKGNNLKKTKTILKNKKSRHDFSKVSIKFFLAKIKLFSLALAMTAWSIMVIFFLPNFVQLVKNDLELLNIFNRATIGRSFLASKKSFQSSQSLLESSGSLITTLVRRDYNANNFLTKDSLLSFLDWQDKINYNLAPKVEEIIGDFSSFISLSKTLISDSIITYHTLPSQINSWQNETLSQDFKVIATNFINFNQSKFNDFVLVSNNLFSSNQEFVLKLNRIVRLRFAQMNLLKKLPEEIKPVVAGARETIIDKPIAIEMVKKNESANNWLDIFSIKQDFRVVAKYLSDFDKLVLEKR